jgi:hypothetical protein
MLLSPERAYVEMSSLTHRGQAPRLNSPGDPNHVRLVIAAMLTLVGVSAAATLVFVFHI